MKLKAAENIFGSGDADVARKRRRVCVEKLDKLGGVEESVEFFNNCSFDNCSFVLNK